MKRFLQLLAMATIFVTGVRAADAPRQAQKGDLIPDVTLKTEAGVDVKLRDAVKTKPTLLVFYRGGWCPYCSRHLMALNGIQEDVTKEGFQILAISADQPSKLAETPHHAELKYPLLSDRSMAGAIAFGITHTVPDEKVAKYKVDYKIDIEAASGEKHHTLPHPAVFIVDTKGVIRFAHVNPDYKVRLDPASILGTVKEVVKETAP
jgi:peroxiredoxin